MRLNLPEVGCIYRSTVATAGAETTKVLQTLGQMMGGINYRV